jgi:acyl-[acyl carrier protein]--UDP-N-acetylglucosamine O-acyltransferase
MKSLGQATRLIDCLIHQCVRVGTLALMQGGSAISKDLPPSRSPDDYASRT